MRFLLQDGTEKELPRKSLERLRGQFPGLQVDLLLEHAAKWTQSAPRSRRPKSNVTNFCRNWLVKNAVRVPPTDTLNGQPISRGLTRDELEAWRNNPIFD